ncbi:transmembrane protein 53-A-like [Varanus komodoensis]|uniref:transmembrane protein 53-A-like n=1 Tax=Varanus komodoensis TaxID=61221 RepID=UPI001CF78564|nr:transmembrane protein 53-A-like [Varanus komodoensis]
MHAASPEPRPDPACASPAFPAPGVAVVTISRTVRLYRPPGPPPGPRPLVLLLPWLGAEPRALAKYLALYLERGWPVLVAESRLAHFLWPRWGLAYAARVLALLAEGEALGGGPLLIHACSIGGYTFAQMMVQLEQRPERLAGLQGRIRGLIYDSLVAGSLADMARGVARMAGSVALRPLIRRGVLLYFRLFRRCTVVHFEAALEVFHRPPLRCPVLVFHCHNDPLSDAGTVQALLGAWRAAGIHAQVQEWPVSHHAGHLRLHPQDYARAVATFLRRLDLEPHRPWAKL